MGDANLAEWITAIIAAATLVGGPLAWIVVKLSKIEVKLAELAHGQASIIERLDDHKKIDEDHETRLRALEAKQ